ncbi:MAG: hypothetical protein LC679_07520 [Intrasporangiaceae bacterium]|nr:hypothetical protein [Intrasporangiaceae bacterium]
MMASWTPLVDVFIVIAFVAIGWVACLTVKGDRDLARIREQAFDAALPRTLMWDPARCPVCADRGEVQDGVCVCEVDA